MNPIILAHQSELETLCRHYRVGRLALFGSAARGDFESARSDIDFLVEFQRLLPTEHADAYFGLPMTLEDLFERPIDLVEEGASRNPFFLQAVEQSSALRYVARISEVPLRYSGGLLKTRRVYERSLTQCAEWCFLLKECATGIP